MNRIGAMLGEIAIARDGQEAPDYLVAVLVVAERASSCPQSLKLLGAVRRNLAAQAASMMHVFESEGKAA